VQISGWDCTVEPDGAIRLGLRYVNGLRQDAGQRIANASRPARPAHPASPAHPAYPAPLSIRRRLSSVTRYFAAFFPLTSSTGISRP